MKEFALAVQKRTESGKGSARRTRMDGGIPGVIYGPKIKPTSISVSEKEFRTSMRGVQGTALINLDVAGEQNKVILRDIQRDPVTNKIIHLDFHAIPMDKPIQVSVPINLVGVPIGVKTDGGIQQVILRELAISCLPTEIPDALEVNVEELHIGESIHVSDLSVGDAQVLTEGERTIVTIAAPTVIKAETTDEEAVEGEEGAIPEEGAAEEGKEEAKEGDEEKKEKKE